MKVAIFTANLGEIDQDNFQSWSEQILPSGWSPTVFTFNDSNFKPRINALHPRLQAKIPKMLGFEYARNYDFYIWIDASFRVSDPYCIQWLVDAASDLGFALFAHPYRSSIAAELEFIEREISNGNNYLLKRYENEPMREQVLQYLADNTFVDDKLYAAGVLAYSINKNPEIEDMLQFWFYQNARWTVQDQLSLPYALSKFSVTPSVLQGDIFSSKFLEFKLHKK